MLAADSFEDSDDGTVFRDVIMLALLGFVTIVILLLPHLNPPTLAEEAIRSPGNVVVDVRWPDEIDADVDLWVEAPGDVPVGYSNKGGRIFNLLRDDLGSSGDAAGLNYEIAFARGVPAGAYTVNLHLYRNNSGRLPVSAVVTVGVKASPDGPVRTIVTRQIDLVRVGQELTVVRFSLDELGDLVPGSMHQIQRGLRTARQ
jgi:hypothetical protein